MTANRLRVISKAIRGSVRVLTVLGAALGAIGPIGCAALTNPVADGVPVRRLPPEVLGESRESFQSVPLTDLTPRPAGDYRLAAGDVLGVFIEGVLGEQNGQPPVRISEQGNLPPAIGYPIPVRENGTLSLPLIDPISMDGLTLDEAQAKIIQAYLEQRKILKLDEKSEGMLFKMLKRRENLGSTGIGRGIAIPHCRSLVVNRLRVAFGRKKAGVDFKAIDDKPVNFFFLIVAPPLEVSNQYLPVLGKIAQFSKEADVPARLLELATPGEFMAILEEKRV